MKELDLSLEKMQYVLFQRHYTSWRIGQIPGPLVDMSDPNFELPNGSTLHTINRFLNPQPIDDISPDINLPMITHEKWRIYLQNVLDISNDESTPYPVNDRYMYMLGKAKSQIVHFFNDHRDIHRIISKDAVNRLNNALVWFDYTAYDKIRTMGRFNDYRKFDIMFRSILNNALNNGENRHHFIVIPMSERIINIGQMRPLFSKIDQSFAKVRYDYSYYFLIHLLGLIYGAQYKIKNITLPSVDIQYWKDHQDSLPSDVELQTIESDHEEYQLPLFRSTSLFERLTNAQCERLNFILTHNDKAIIYNLADIRHFSSTGGFINRVVRHVNTLKLVALGHEETDIHKLTDDEFHNQTQNISLTQKTEDIPDSHPDDASLLDDEEVSPQTSSSPSTDDPGEPLSASSIPLSPVVQKPSYAPSTPSTPFNISVKNKITEYIDKTTEQDKKASTQKRVESLWVIHNSATINGKSIAEYLEHTPDASLHVNKIESLENKLPDNSMLDSTISDMDKNYIQNQHYKDLAHTLTAFVEHGFFVMDVKEEVYEDKFTRYKTYKVKFVDVNGKQHNIVFKLPLVDVNGNIMVNGVKIRMIKQNINLPICKIGEDRVNLSSNYNKALVERTSNVSHNFSIFITRYLNILKKNGLVTVEYGDFKTGAIPLPYEYSSIAETFSSVTLKGYSFIFDYPHRFDHYPTIPKESFMAYESQYGTLCGTSPDGSYLFWDKADRIHAVKPDGTHVTSSIHFMSLIEGLFSQDITIPKITTEWVNLRLLSKSFPVIFILGFRYGLKATLDYIHLNYRFYGKDEKFPSSIDTIVIPFADGSLVFSRYPLEKSLIAAGLLWFDTKKYTFNDLNAPDVYYSIMSSKDISTNFLKGISSFFDLFVDPITRDVLERMGEPTNVRDLLIRATEMLSTRDHYPSSSMRHHRTRGYERLSSTLYNEMSRQFAAYKAQRNPNKSFSINPEAVFQKIMQDSTVINEDTINPIHELKTISNITFGGSGGRTSQSFVVKDRQYPEDGMGIISESTVDSGKVAMTVYTSSNPRYDNIRGIIDPSVYEDKASLEPAEMLSISSMLFPCVTQDDGKRANYVSHQLSHHVPCEEGEVSRIRTGYEQTIAHRVSGTFAVVAKDNGSVISVDPTLKIAKVQYVDTPIQTKGTLKLTLPTTELEKRKSENVPVYILVSENDISHYFVNQYLSISKDLVGHILSIKRITDIKDLRDPYFKKNYETLYNNLDEHKIDHVYLLTLEIISHMKKGDIEAVQYEDQYSSTSGSYLLQTITLNVKEGDKIKKGDVLAYNSGFFLPDPLSKQVSWKHGVMANIALIDTSFVLEDGSVISQKLSEQLKMSPAHMRTIMIDNRTVIHDSVNVGDHVETTDKLCIIEDGDLGVLTDESDMKTHMFLSDLNKRIPKSKYFGTVSDISIYYTCDYSDLHPSIQKLVKRYDKKHRSISHALVGTAQEGTYFGPGPVPVGMKYHGQAFEKGSVVIEYTIVESIKAGQGDKIVVGAQLKTVISTVSEKPLSTESGVPVDMIFGTAGPFNRIVSSPFIIGIGDRVLEKLEQDVLAIWDKD